MRYWKIAVLLTLAAAGTACSWRRTPVPVMSDSGSISALVGEWAGEYSSNDTGRRGSIMFQLASERDTAYGDVLMVPRTHDVQIPAQERPQIAAAVRTHVPPEPLQIRFVRMEGGRVSGRLAPYTDPDCGCTVITTYEGTFTDASTIEGTYRTQGTNLDHRPAAGRWKVTRQHSKVTIP